MVYQLEIVEGVRLEWGDEGGIFPIIMNIIMAVALVLIWLENAISFDRELEVEDWGVHVLVFVPAAVKERLLKARIAFADKNFRFLVETMLLPE